MNENTTRPAFRRLPLVAGALLTLVLATWGGLMRLQWPLPSPTANWVSFHGPLMVCGFLGTLIGVERAVALGKSWGYLGPFLSLAGSVYFLAGGLGKTGALLFFAAGLALVFIYLDILLGHPSLYHLVQMAGAVAWAVGSFLWWKGLEVPLLVQWWGAFLVLTILGERLELTRFMKPIPGSHGLFLVSVGVYWVGLLLSLGSLQGMRVAAAGMALLALWLTRYDLALTTWRKPGVTGFTGTCLLSGFVWLLVAGLLVLWGTPHESGFVYDAALHALFLGFAFSMVFGHAPIIFPSVTRVGMSFHRAFYLHLILLHLSVAVRVGSDLALWAEGRKWGALLNALALSVFLFNTVRSVRPRRPV